MVCDVGGTIPMSGENRRSREAVRDSIRTYGVKVMDPASLPLRRTEQRESQDSISRYSEKYHHSHYKSRGGFWNVCLNRMPFATLIAFLICIVGVLMFSASTQRSAVLTNKMLAEVLAADGSRVLTFDIIFIVLEITTAMVALVILVVGILATGDTRTRVYSNFSARLSGQMCCIILMVITSLLLLAWLLIFSLFSILFFVGVVSQSVCTLDEELTEKTCLHLSDLRIFANFETKEIEVCGKTKIKAFCKDFVEKISPAYIVAGIGNLLIILGLGYSTDLYYRQRWMDKRLAFHGTKETTALLMLEKIWKPDTYFCNGKQSYLHTITTPTNSSGCIRVAGFCIPAVGYTTNDVIYEWNSKRQIVVAEDMKLSQFDLIAKISTNQTDKVDIAHSHFFTIKEYSTLSVSFHLQRHMGKFLIQFYGPCILLVVLSWVSFWLNREATADRVSLGSCKACVNRMPWATFIGFLFVLVGLLMFIVASLRSAALTNRMIADVLVEDSTRVATFDIVFIVLEASTGVLALLVLLVGVLATGETRSRVYNSINARVTGKLSIIILMFITSILLLAWLLVFWLFSILFYVGIVSQSVCHVDEELTDKTCLHLSDLRIFANVESGDIEVCGKTKIRAFCSEFAEKTSPAYVLAGIGNFLIILGLIIFLVCLAANYARIRCQAKYQEMDEVRRYEHPEIRIIKHRF